MKKVLFLVLTISLLANSLLAQSSNWREFILDGTTNFYEVQKSFEEEWRVIERPYPKGK